MSFIESRPLDKYMALGSSGGAEYQTDIIELSSGIEQRNQAWAYPRHRYIVGISAGTSGKIETLRQLQHTTRGAFNGFRFKDFNDYSSAEVSGEVTAFDDQEIGAGDGVSLTYQLLKNYSTGSGSVTRKITKIATGFVLGFTGSGWAVADDSSRWSVDVNTGIVTFDADTQETITNAVNQGGGVTRLTTSTPHGLSASGTVYLSTFTSPWSGMNARRVDIVATSINTIDVTFDSSGFAAYSGNAGQINTLPQAGDVITWGGDFDVPVRFSSDSIQIQQISPGIEQASIELIEIK